MNAKVAPIACGLAFAAILAVAGLGWFRQNNPSDKAFAVVTPPTSTPGPTPTPLPGDLYDLWDIETGPGQFHCIARTDQDPVTLGLSATAQCYSETDTGFTGSEPPCDAVYSTGATPVPVVPGEGDCDGHVSPPAYTSKAPVQLAGSYDPSTYTVSYKGCFADVGGPAGPNIVVVFTGLPGTMTAKVWFNQTNANCDANPPTPSGGYFTYPATMTGVNPQRVFCSIQGNCPTTTSISGCKDADALWAGRPGGAATCGDDPWNPFAVQGVSPDVSGSWDIMIEKQRADVAAPGYYFECQTDIQQNGTSLTAPVLCYVDSRGVTVNPQAAAYAGTPVSSCAIPPATPQPGLTADPKYCGDGLPGSSPPGCNSVSPGTSACEPLAPNCQGGIAITSPCNVSQYQFAAIGSSEATLTGALDATGVMSFSGCHLNLGGAGNVYLQAKINAYTGIGIGNLYSGQTTGNCTGGTPTGSANFVNISAVRQAPGAETGCTSTSVPPCRDSSGSGCPDKDKLQSPKIGFNLTGTVSTRVPISGRATGASTGPPGTLIDAGAAFPSLVGAIVTAGGETITVASNTATVITGTAGWSGGGNPGAVAYTISPALVGASTSFTTELAVGDTVHVPGETAKTVAAISDDTHLNVDSNFANTNSGQHATADQTPQDAAKVGGLRDPFNRFDYPDVTGDHKIRVDDITYVVNRYRHDQGGTVAPLYDARADHTIVAGSNLWNLGPPDGQIRTNDVTAVVNQYRNDCS